MERSRLMAIDPSFSRTGVSLFDMDTGEISIASFSEKLGSDMTFNNVVRSARALTKRLLLEMDVFRVRAAIMETPPPVAQFSAGLFSLDTLFLSRMYDSGVGEVYTVSPRYIAHVHGKSKVSKADNKQVVTGILSSCGYRYRIDERTESTKRLNHDMADSLILLFRLMIKFGFDSPAFAEYGLHDEREILF